MSRLTIFFMCCITIYPSVSHALTLTGKVISIADGDTITVLDSSKKYTAKLTARKMATVTEYDMDRYGRTVGVVKVGGVNVNESLIKAGLAWQYKKYCRAAFCKDWLQEKKKASKSQIGLWRDSDPVPPWQ